MEIREMQSFVLLAQFHSILRTADALNLTPGAVHKHLKTLEVELGAALYEKHEGSLRLTREGHIVLPFFIDVIERRGAAVKALADFREGANGSVRVGAGPSFSSYMLPDLLRKFRARFGNVDVFIETGNGDHLLQGLRAGTLDLIFDPIAPSPQEDLQIAATWDAEIGLVSAQSSIPARTPMSRLRSTPFILFQKGSRMDEMVQRHFERIGFEPNVVMRSDSSEAIKAMVKNRLGVAMLFLWNANPDLRNGSLRIVKTDAPPLTARMGLIQRKTSYTPKASAAFIEIAKSINWRNLHPTARPAASGGLTATSGESTSRRRT